MRPYNVIFVNTDTAVDYKFPLDKIGSFSPVIKISEERDLNILFNKQQPADYMNFPLDTSLVSRVLRSYCAMNRLSPEYIEAMETYERNKPNPSNEPPVVKTLKRTYRKRTDCDVKRKKVSKCQKRLRDSDADQSIRKTESVIFPSFALGDFASIPLSDENFTSGLINPDTGFEYPTVLETPPISYSNPVCAQCSPVNKPIKPIEPGKLVVSCDRSTLDLRVIQADERAKHILQLKQTSNISLKSLFGFATNHQSILDIQQAAQKGLPISKYILLYPSNTINKKPCSVYLTFNPITCSYGPCNEEAIAIISVQEASSIGFLKLKASFDWL